MKSLNLLAISTSLCAITLLSGCSGENVIEASYPTRGEGDNDIIYTDQEQLTIFSEGGILDSFGFGGNKSDEDTGGTGIGVNSLLWRASLDSISFMPLASADPFGGTIITDWYQKPSNLNERVKMTILILSKELRSDALKVDIFRQTRSNGSEWQQATVSEATKNQLSSTILRRARDMRQAQNAE